MHAANFAPGPSQLYFTVADHLRTAFQKGIPSISHRGKVFENIVMDVHEGLCELTSLPSDMHLFFTSSASEIFERSVQNLVEKNSFHFVNGAFSKRYHDISLQLKKQATKYEVPPGMGFDTVPHIPDHTEMVTLTQNETSTGVSTPLSYIETLQEKAPNALIAVDAVSSFPYPNFNFHAVDSIFFSVQKAFGLPAGLGVWLINNRGVEKANSLLARGHCIGSFHSLPVLHKYGRVHQTPETPNVLAIYLLSQVIKDFIRRGINTLRTETEYKSAILYSALSQHNYIAPFVTKKEWQSNTVIVADCGHHTLALRKFLQKHGLEPGDGYGEFKNTQLRFANFPTHSKEQYEKLVDCIHLWQP